MSARWMAWDEGCGECGEASGVVGLFDTEAEAQAASIAAEERQADDWHGHHVFMVVDLANPVMSEYAPKAES